MAQDNNAVRIFVFGLVCSWFLLAPLYLIMMWWLLTIIIVLHIGGWVYRVLRRREVREKTILITGGAKGLGKATAKQFVQNRACKNKLILWDINEAALLATKQEIEALWPGVTVATYIVDVARNETVEAAARQTLLDHGYVDIVILNAGVVSAYDIVDLPFDKMRRVFEVNTFQLFSVTKPFLQRIFQDEGECGLGPGGRGGHFVVIASVAGYHGAKTLSDYAASKSAAISFSESLRFEAQSRRPTTCRGNNITVTCVCPYFINTGMFTGTTMLRFFPMLEERDVAESIYESVARKQELVVLPSVLHPLLLLVKALLPTTCTPYIDAVLGSSKSMSTFRGRKL